MNRIFLRLLLSAVFWVPISAVAEEGDTNTSGPPSLKPLPDGIRWVITVKPPGRTDGAKSGQIKEGASATNGQKDPWRIQQVEAEYAGGVRREEVRMADGSKQRSYRTKGYLVMEGARQQLTILDAIDLADNRLSARPDLFDELSWVAPQYFVGKATFNKRPCAVYRRGKQAGQAASRDEPEETVYLDLATGLPVVWEHPAGIWSYQFERTKTSVELPPAYAEAIRSHEARLKRASKKYDIPQ